MAVEFGSVFPGANDSLPKSFKDLDLNDAQQVKLFYEQKFSDVLSKLADFSYDDNETSDETSHGFLDSLGTSQEDKDRMNFLAGDTNTNNYDFNDPQQALLYAEKVRSGLINQLANLRSGEIEKSKDSNFQF